MKKQTEPKCSQQSSSEWV